ncbi:MAG: hypothetical protein IID51_00790 [Proteobacteria bacterium]|nr:hypothetical protein [Pseudomonadota bacterium]
MKTPKNKPKNAKKKPKRRRKLPYVYTGDYHLEEELTAILYKGDQRLKVYVYKAVDCPPRRKVYPQMLPLRGPGGGYSGQVWVRAIRDLYSRQNHEVHRGHRRGDPDWLGAA